jgi:hypothetical protein
LKLGASNKISWLKSPPSQSPKPLRRNASRSSALRRNGAEITSLVVLVPSLTLRHCVQQEICKILKIFLRFAQKFSELRKSPRR